ncbi:hypothetical protein ACFSR9_07060 [Deinococcus taklimakanensis]|uniref:Uncharacterized protein n=1 Tax=Deinococcus taklimakanensis TaxID=536443 RepID=A0ABW5P2S0_9DEIO
MLLLRAFEQEHALAHGFKDTEALIDYSIGVGSLMELRLTSTGRLL